MQITFDFSAQKISFDGPEMELVELLKLVREIAPKIPAITINAPAVVASGRDPATPVQKGNGAGDNGGNQTMRQFVRSMELGNVSEKIAAIAYYQKQAGKASLSPKEMADLFVQCGIQKPTQMPVAMFDAKRKYGFMESASHGQWRISTQGENLILGKLEAKTEAEVK